MEEFPLQAYGLREKSWSCEKLVADDANKDMRVRSAEAVSGLPPDAWEHGCPRLTRCLRLFGMPMSLLLKSESGRLTSLSMPRVRVNVDFKFNIDINVDDDDELHVVPPHT